MKLKKVISKFQIYNYFEVDVDILDEMNFEIKSKIDNPNKLPLIVSFYFVLSL